MTGQGEAQFTQPHTASAESAAAQGREYSEQGGAEPKRPYMSSAVEQTGKMLHNLSQKIRALAESLREESGPHQRVRRTVERVANKLESSADYLQGADTGAIASDMSGAVRRYPLRTLGICLGVGIVLGAALRRRGA
jgi:ElaB/YqjD/DUF883 family membrane-anchored ribosome-binding protein